MRVLPAATIRCPSRIVRANCWRRFGNIFPEWGSIAVVPFGTSPTWRDSWTRYNGWTIIAR
jgi:hypothetical protein